jgi:acetyltransferase
VFVSPLEKILAPRSIATAGAGNNLAKMGTMHALSILKDGYKGHVYPIHLKDKTVLGEKAYKSVQDLPETPDLAVLIVPVGNVPALLDEFGKRGTRHAIIITAGFKETGHQGKKFERSIVEIAEKHGMRFLGPNCIGVINTEISLNTTVYPMLMRPGKLGFISQSGTYITQTLSCLRKKGIRFSKAISVGNEANIDAVDALRYLGKDEQTRAISMYLEGIRNVPAFLEVARRITPYKPIIAQYVGGSKAGARSGLSHTGALAGPDHLYDGLFKQAGIIRVDSVEELYEFGWSLATQPRLKGKRIGIITNSGGPGSAIAHTCEMQGLEVPAFDEELQSMIKPMLPDHAPAGNPVDMTFSTDLNALSEKIPKIIAEKKVVDGIIIHGAMMTGMIKAKFSHIKEIIGEKLNLERILSSRQAEVNSAAELPHRLNMPFIISSFFGQEDNYTEAYQQSDIPVFGSPEKAARAMGVLLRYKKVTERKPFSLPDLPPVSATASEILSKAKRTGITTLDEYSAKKLLQGYGIPIPIEIRVEKESEFAEAVRSVGCPVAVKACDPQILHKTEKDLVRLNISTVEEALQACKEIRQAAGEKVPILVSEMVTGKREFLAGIARDKLFGPVVVFGLGGILTEALNDTGFRLAPLSIPDAEEMIGEIRSGSILDEYRGMPKVNTTAMADLIQRLGFISILHPEIREIDLNPVIIKGSEPVVVDALIVFE